MGSRFTTNIGPGNTIGAMAIGDGAVARGSVTVGGNVKTTGGMRLKFKARHMTREEMAKRLEEAATILRAGKVDSCADGDAPGGPSFAWTVESDD